MKVHLYREKKNILSLDKTYCGKNIKKHHFRGRMIEIDKNIFLNHWDISIRCKNCENNLINEK